jgi:RimJ/RimL family protein N-acetyltransferase
LDDFPILTTGRLLLREFKETDAQAVFDIFSGESVTRHLDSDTMRSIDEAERKTRGCINLFNNRHGMRWAITLKEKSDTAIGSCGFFSVRPAWFSCEVGYELHPDYWRKGVMTEALTAIIDFAYTNRFFFPLNRIQALTYLDNPASVGLLKRLGFQDEGIRREYTYWKNRFNDLRCFSLLRREWEERSWLSSSEGPEDGQGDEHYNEKQHGQG